MMNRSLSLNRHGAGIVLAIFMLLGILVLSAKSLAADGMSMRWSVQDDTNMGKPEDPDTKSGSLTVPVTTRIESAGQLDHFAIPFLTLTGQILMFTVDVSNFSTLLNPHVEIR